MIGSTTPAPVPPKALAARMYLAFGVLALIIGALVLGSEAIVCAILGVATTVGLIVSVRRRKPAAVWPWMCMVAAFALFIVDGAARTSFATLGNVTAGRSLIPDIIALPGYVLLAAGLLGFSRSRVRR